MKTLERTPRTTLRRRPDRGTHEWEEIADILDEAFICHVGFCIDGQPFVIPTTHARVEDVLYLHGAAASRMLKALRSGVDVCVTATLLDGLVLARSAMHHSMNYRSVVLFGRAEEVADPARKGSALEALVNRVAHGRASQVRPPDERELAATSVLALPICEASAKVRRGPPIDDEADLSYPVWAGVIPLRTRALAPVADPLLRGSFEAPRAPAVGLRDTE